MTIQIPDSLIFEIERMARSQGLERDAYVASVLAKAIDGNPGPAAKHSVMEFCGVAPSGRTGDEIEAYIRSLRNEWD